MSVIRKFPVLLLVSSYVVTIIYTSLISGARGEGPVEKYDCMNIVLRASKATMRSLTVCGKVLKDSTTNSKEFQEKFACVLKCAMERVNLTNAEHLITEETMLAMLKKYLPTDDMIQEVRRKIITPCDDIALKLDPNDEYCKTYADYALCMQSGMEDFMTTSEFCIRKPKRKPQASS